MNFFITGTAFTVTAIYAISTAASRPHFYRHCLLRRLPVTAASSLAGTGTASAASWTFVPSAMQPAAGLLGGLAACQRPHIGSATSGGSATPGDGPSCTSRAPAAATKLPGSLAGLRLVGRWVSPGAATNEAGIWVPGPGDPGDHLGISLSITRTGATDMRAGACPSMNSTMQRSGRPSRSGSLPSWQRSPGSSVLTRPVLGGAEARHQRPQQETLLAAMDHCSPRQQRRPGRGAQGRPLPAVSRLRSQRLPCARCLVAKRQA